MRREWQKWIKKLLTHTARERSKEETDTHLHLHLHTQKSLTYTDDKTDLKKN